MFGLPRCASILVQSGDARSVDGRIVRRSLIQREAAIRLCGYVSVL